VRRLRSVAGLLPGDCQATLEARLASGTAPVDLSLRLLDPGQAGRMAERFPSFPLQSFLSRWPEPVSALWLEFDLDRAPRKPRTSQTSRTLPFPVVCAKLPRTVDADWLADGLLPALHGAPLLPEQRELVHRAVQEIPAPASLLYAFSLRSRGQGAVRLEIFGMEPAQILDYLGRVAPARVSDAAGIAPLFEGVERIHLSFDVASEVLPRIGIEGSFSRLPPREPRWPGLFDRLVERGLCSPEKRDAALAWSGYDSFWTAPAAWPLDKTGIGSTCVRTLSHVKAVCRPGREPEAKVYLTFGPLERSGAGAPASSPANRSAFCT
jgi:hypothetical protein